MRPIRINVSGFRSFRTAQTVDFADLGLFAIVGDTGAGKSSILEAMVYALYNKSTYDERAVKSLIALDADTMRVDFTFAVGNAHYVVTRSASNITGRPAIHGLQSLANPEARFQGEASVTAEIVRLTKLDYRTFTKTVVLPQGRFAELLTASGSEREPVLTALFALDEVDRLRDSLLQPIAKAAERCVAVRSERATYGDDPALQLANAKEHKSKAEAAYDLVTSIAMQCASLTNAQQGDIERKRRFGDAEQRIDELDIAAQRIESLEARHDALREERAANDAAQSIAANERVAARNAAARLREDGRDSESLQRIRDDLRGIADFASRRDADELMLREEEGQLRKREMELAAKLRELEASEQERLVSEASARVAEVEYQSALEDRESAADAWHTLILARRSVRDATTSYQRAALELSSAQSECERASTAADFADRAAESARLNFEHAQIANLAATIGAAVRTGDACPVCAQRVPEDYLSPPDSGLEAARELEMRARRDQAQKQSAVTALRFRIDQLLSTVENQLRVIEVASRTEEDAQHAAAGMKLDVAGENEIEALRSVTQKWEIAKRTRDTASVCERKATDAVVESRALCNALQSFNVQGREQVKARRAGVVALCERIEKVRLAICDAFRPTQTSEAVIEAALSHIDEAIEAAREVRLRADTAEATFLAADRAAYETHQCLLVEVVAVVDANLAACDATLRVLAHEDFGLTLEAAPARLKGDVELALLWASSVRAWCIEARAAVNLERSAADQRIAEKQSEIANHLTGAAVDSVTQLDERRRQAATQVAVLDDRIVKARQNLERAERATARLAEIEPLANGLEALKGHLDSNRFKKYLTGLRESRLLGVATDIFHKMSDGRFAFAAGFQILDGHTQLTRDPKTLSGGEKFLASLALALGLVELTTRTGARLDALFLDEGFGSLDASALDAALLELKERADSGKLIGVITHVRGIAAEIEDIIRVERRSGGSIATKLTGTERNDMLNRAVISGLLEAAS